MKQNKERKKLQTQFLLYVQSVLMDFDHPETILTIKKAAGLIAKNKEVRKSPRS